MIKTSKSRNTWSTQWWDWFMAQIWKMKNVSVTILKTSNVLVKNRVLMKLQVNWWHDYSLMCKCWLYTHCRQEFIAIPHTITSQRFVFLPDRAGIRGVCRWKLGSFLNILHTWIKFNWFCMGFSGQYRTMRLIPTCDTVYVWLLLNACVCSFSRSPWWNLHFFLFV